MKISEPVSFISTFPFAVSSLKEAISQLRTVRFLHCYANSG